ncbi:hypothetical protein [Aquisalimonas asiatica]|uniref:DUF7931 domain-containing protein n=1 Tax=Aquisalimonas asiatica TaxID=406100 RepID=A0A1H8QE80_9GAMM|nr:hypothetical protein [Aquisalimonas asiatica]SEO52083.1 hypothetical protein SAMN04488052_101504 [Aquisalimonas asiatica]
MRRRITSAGESGDAVTELLAAARGTVDILSPGLDPVLFDHDEVVASLRTLVVNAGRRARVRLLLCDSTAAVRGGHRLMGLARQLTTAMEIRRLADEDAGDEATWVIVDARGVAQWPGAGYEGVVDPDSRALAMRTARLFSERWERAEPDPETRRLTL